MLREVLHTNSLANLVRRYQVGFWVTPDRVDIVGRTVEVAFQLVLRGAYHHAFSADDKGQCRECIRVLTALFELADALAPIARESLKGMECDYEKCLRYARKLNSQGGVAVVFEIKARRTFERANDGWGTAFLQKMTRRLLEYGCDQLESPAEAEGSGTVPFKSNSHSFLEGTEAHFAAAPVA